jgi:hypothetical protein
VASDKIETHIKLVRGKKVLVPSLALVKGHIDPTANTVDGQLLREKLKQDFAVQLICPVTLRKYFKDLNVKVDKRP